MKYHVRQIGDGPVGIEFHANYLNVDDHVRVAYIRYSPYFDATTVTCWDKPDVRLRNPLDPETDATITKA